MKMNFAKMILPLGLTLTVLSGGATYPVAKSLRQQARPITLEQAKADPAGHQGTIVIWGGRIIKTVNTTDGGKLYLLKLPLARDEKPLAGAYPAGRFIARSSDFLDPEIYRRGRLVTVAGSLAGLKTEPVQKTNYAYPVVTIQQTHVWAVHRRTYYYYPAWGGVGYYPGWDWGLGVDWYYPRRDWDRDDYGGHWERAQSAGHAGHYGDRDGAHWENQH